MFDVLIQRIIRLEKALARAEERGNRLESELNRVNTDLFKLFEMNRHEMDAVFTRLTSLEDKVFPNTRPTFKRIEKIVGKQHGWQMTNPLDERKRDL